MYRDLVRVKRLFPSQGEGWRLILSCGHKVRPEISIYSGGKTWEDSIPAKRQWCHCCAQKPSRSNLGEGSRSPVYRVYRGEREFYRLGRWRPRDRPYMDQSHAKRINRQRKRKDAARARVRNAWLLAIRLAEKYTESVADDEQTRMAWDIAIAKASRLGDGDWSCRL